MRNQSEEVTHFRKTRLSRFYAEESDIAQVELFLPASFPHTHGKDTLAEATRQREAAYAAKEREDRQKDAAQNQADEGRPVRAPFGASSKKVGAENQLEEARSKLQQASVVGGVKVPKGKAVVYAWDEPMKLIAQTRTPDRDAISRNKRIFDALLGAGNVREVSRLSRKQLEGAFAKLESVHPNFSAVIGHVRRELLLSIVRKRPLRFAPLLLAGPPGVGKTHFAKSLAIALRTTATAINFDSALTSSALLGSDRNWANTSIGKVFEAVVLGKYANPVLVLDEICKAESGQRYQHPLASLHSLLEPISSGAVTDISAEFTFDASNVLWIATANDLSRIPFTILSRFSIHIISKPTQAQSLQLAQILLDAVHRDMDIRAFVPPAAALARHIAHLSARDMRRAIEAAYGRAIDELRFELHASDFGIAESIAYPSKPGAPKLH